MSKLNKLIQELCPDGVEYKRLEECCNILDKNRKPITKSLRVAGEYPYYGANGIQDYVANYIFDGRYVLVGEDGSVITPKGKPVVNWAEGKIWVNNHAHIIEEKEGVLLRFLYHFIQTVDITTCIHGNIPKFTGGDFKNILIPVPPLPVQEEIVRILDTFSQLITELKAELKARKKQYEYYKNTLLTFTNKVPFRRLDDVIVSLNTGLNPRKFFKLNTEDATNYYVTIREIHNNRIQFSDSTDRINNEALRLCNNRSNLEVGDILFSGTGTIGETAIIEENPKNWNIKEGVYVLKPITNVILSKFLMYILQSQSIRISYSKKVAGGTVKSIPMKDLKNIVIPIPSLPVQKQIVNILDRFDTLCNDLTQGIPAEIEARQKQYEYYRDKLLTFKKK